jgi:hypothetical protein
MAEKKTQAEVEAENAALKKRIEQLEAQQPGAISAQDRAKLAAMKSKAKKEDGNALYRVGPQGHYRDGRLYAHGEIVRIPLEQDPSVTFEAVEDEPAGKAAPTPPKATTGGRASDKEL